MPNTKSAKKNVRKSAKRCLRNKSHKSATRTEVKRFYEAIASQDVEKAKEELRKATSKLDKLCQKKIFHINNSSRRKSRLAKKLNVLCKEISAEASSTTSETPANSSS